jgi:hypothetical protein
MKTQLTISSGALILMLSACSDGTLACTVALIDVCQKATDVSTYIGTEVAGAIVGGNAIMGEGGALNVPARMSLSVRTNMMGRSVPRIGNPALRTDGVAGTSTFAVREGTAATYVADVALGALPGFRVGETRVGGLDLLGSASLIPAFSSEDLQMHSKRRFGYGLGLRVGLIEETATLPGVSIAAIFRQAPRLTAATTWLPMADGRRARVSFTEIDVLARTLRVAASKRFGRFGLTGGLGRDSYDVTAGYRIAVSDDNESTYGPIPTSLELKRNTAFGGASLALGSATLGAEFGTVFAAGKPALVNTFGGKPIDRTRAFLTFGVKMSAGRTR